MIYLSPAAEIGIFVLFAVVFAATCILLKKEPRKFINGFLLELSVILFALCIVVLIKDTAFAVPVIRTVMYLYIAVCALCGFGLVANAVAVIKKERISLAHILPLFFGIAVIAASGVSAWDLRYGLSGNVYFVNTARFMINLVEYIPLALWALFNYNIIYSKLKKNKNPDYIIVLGCGLKKNGEATPLLKGRLETAKKRFELSGKKSKIIVSGGKGSDEIISEAQAMENYLVSVGVDKSAVIKEDKSTTTRENLLFSKAIAEKEKKDASFMIATSNYHVLRAVILAHKLGIKAEGVGSKTALYYYPAAFFREYIALIFSNKIIVALYVVLAAIMTFI